MLAGTSGTGQPPTTTARATPRDASAVSRSSTTPREDPWPQMQKQVATMLNDLTLQLGRFRETANPTVVAENEVLEAISGCTEAVEDMRFALDTAMEHPESFSITAEELQSRAECIRSWEREMMRAEKTAEAIRAAQRRRAQSHDDNMDSGMRENNDFLRQEHDVQNSVMQTDDQTLDRLSSGIHRVKDTAVNIQDELQTQEHILDDIDRGMTRVQMRIDGAMKKVGKLIDSTSDTGKLICIGILFLILIFLIVVVIR